MALADHHGYAQPREFAAAACRADAGQGLISTSARRPRPLREGGRVTGERLDLSAKFVPPEPAGLFRGRLLDIAAQRVGLVLAPAGHGKTTLLGQIASRFPGSAAWYRIDTADRNIVELAPRIGRILVRLFSPGSDGRVFDSFDQVAAALEVLPAGGNVLLVLDDFHLIAGSESERGLVRL